MSVSPASAIGRRRFRLAWQTSVDRTTEINGREPSSSLRNIEVLWLADSENSNMLSVPLVDVLGSRIEQRAITVSDAASVQWRLEGINSWIPIAMRSNRQAEWESADLNQSFSIPENAQPAVLRRIPNARQVSSRTQTNILFQSPRLECRSTTTWSTPMAISNEIEVVLPPHAVMMSGKINGSNAMWNQLNVKGTEVVRFFLSKNESMIQSLEWTYQVPTMVDQWQRFPISRVRGFDEGDHRVNAYSQDERTIEFQNVEFWPSTSSSIGSEDASPSKNRRWLWSRRVPSTAYSSLDDAAFPSFCLREHGPIEGKMVASLSPVGPSWQLHIDGKLASSSRKEIVLDLPTNLVSSISSEKGIVTAHPGNASRSFLRVPLENFFFHFDCLLPLDSSSVLNLPDIRVVDGSQVMTYWKLPNSANGMRVVVETPGLEKVEDVQLQTEIGSWIAEQRDSSGLFAKRLDRISLRLEPAERASTIVSCKGVVQTLNVDRQFDWTLRCDYWLLPLNQGVIEIRMAEGVKLVRATIHDRDATQVSDGFARIETHPGEAPFLLSLFLQGGKDTLDQVRWRQSHALVDVTVDKVFWTVHLPSDRLTLSNQPVGKFTERSAWGQELLKDGLDLLSQGSNAIAQREAKYRHGWYLPWRQYLRQEIASVAIAEPRSVSRSSKGFDDSDPWIVPLQRLEELDRKLEVTEGQKKGWNGLLFPSEGTEVETYCWIDTVSKPGKIDSLESLDRDGGWQIRAKPEAEGDWIAKALWSGGALLVFLLLWSQLAKWQTAFEFLQQRPWWLVTMSSVLFAMVFPGLNIGVVLGLLAVISAVQAYWIEWQRTRRLRRA